MDDCKTSQRKALTEVDNYTADGYEGFQTMEIILEQLPLAKDTKQVYKSSLKDALMYLKGNDSTSKTKRVCVLRTVVHLL